ALPGSRLEAVAGHDALFDVAVGTEPVPVRTVTYDRNIADGAPVAGDSLRCAEPPRAVPAVRS
ncbi:hypothetical protein VR43_18045, partial [Streptomyces sp. NRRL S-104]